MKRRIKKDNQRRELLNIPVPEAEVVDVPDSDTEKDTAESKSKDEKSKDEKSKEESKSSERHVHRDDRSPERRRTSPRRRPSPPRYRGYVGHHLHRSQFYVNYLPQLDLYSVPTQHIMSKPVAFVISGKVYSVFWKLGLLINIWIARY